ncbi:hypothetical protein FGD71_021515 [Streptomyces sporangiiformans]|uniref:Uncharacterized protein n=1 Tax=Streptomyces sporangiiformans TaxID=2315329 RepID=A0A505DKD6_9ACTN|nr:hypothetical protein FGD71_021515 [Streptomyces sporangiiformans]
MAAKAQILKATRHLRPCGPLPGADGASPFRGCGAFRVTPRGAGLAFPQQVGAGCVSGREGLATDPVRGPTEDPGSIGLAVPNMRLRRVARHNGKKNTGVTT